MGSEEVQWHKSPEQVRNIRTSAPRPARLSPAEAQSIESVEKTLAHSALLTDLPHR